MKVLVLDKHKKPLMPCSLYRAHLLLNRGRAVVHRRYPFIIRLKDRVGGEKQDVRVKLDPGSKTTGSAIAREEDGNKGTTVLWLGELTHRGQRISKRLTARRAFRRRRRNANLRYRAPRFDNRGGDRTGWLAPSLRHRIDTCMSWVKRLRRWVPVTGLAVERVRFDMQLLENPEISGVEYQRGTLVGTEVREYVLERGKHHCAYCGRMDVPLNLDHVIPRARGGSNRPSNLVPACIACNEEKRATPVEVFLAKRPDVLARVKAQLKAPLKDAAAVNATRWALWEALQDTGLPVEASSRGRTKFNRTRLGIPKTHALDAACVGQMENLTGWNIQTLEIEATGRGSYCRTKLTGTVVRAATACAASLYGAFRPATWCGPRCRKARARACTSVGSVLRARANSPLAESKTWGGNGAALFNAGMDMDTPSGKPASAGCALIRRHECRGTSRRLIVAGPVPTTRAGLNDRV